MDDTEALLKTEYSNLCLDVEDTPWLEQPVPFAEFVISKEHMNFPPLSPKQMEASLAILGENPLEMFDATKRKFLVSCCMWGKGSLAEDELFSDAKTGVERTIAEWAEINRPINVRTYDFQSKAIKIVSIDAPVLEDVGEILEVFTDNHERVRVNTEHKFWSNKNDWVRAGDLKPNDVLGSTMGLPLLMEVKTVRVTGIRKVGPKRFYGLTVPTYGNYVHQNLIHKNSGKDSLAALIVCYVVYVLLCLKDPNQHITGHHIADEPIDIVNVAYSADQANNVFFTKLRSRVKNWKWLRKQYKMKQSGRILEAKDKSKFQEDATDNTVTVYPTTILFPHMIRAFSRHSLSESTEGLNIVAWIMDEACFEYRQPIILADGSKRCIGDIVKNQEDVSVLSYNFKTEKIEAKKVVAWYKFVPRDTHYLRVRCNGFTGSRTKTILGTPNHHIFTDNGVRRLDELVVGDNIYGRGVFLSQRQKQILYGSLLGDAGISHSGNLTFVHGQDQKDYLDFKVKTFFSMAGGQDQSRSGYKPNNIVYRARCFKTEDIAEIQRLVYPNGKKTVTKEWVDKLDLQSLAFWYLDDGYLAKRTKIVRNKPYITYVVRICAAGLSRKEIDLLYKRIQEFGFRGGIVQKRKYFEQDRGWDIYLNPHDTRRFLQAVSSYIPTCMQYKSIYPCTGLAFDDSISVKLLPVTSIEPIKIKKYAKVYDIEVADNHNYFAGNVLVSNSAMADDTQKANADKLYQMLRSSAQSRFAGKWFGMVLSWPRHKGDFTMRMYADAQQGKLPDVFASKGATWEVNPTKTRDDFKAELDNPATATDAAGMYECNPPQQIEAFFDFPEKITVCVSGRPQIAEFNTTLNTAPTGAVLIGKVISKFNISRQPDTRRYVARCDLGETRDIATLAIGHLEGVMVVVDLLTHWKADRVKKIPVDIDDPANIIIQLREKLIPITHCSFDQWQSSSSINRLNRASILTAKLSLNLEDYKLFRSCVYSQTIDLLNYPLLTDPSTGELANLRLMNGIKVDHDSSNANDLSEAVCGLVSMLVGARKNIDTMKAAQDIHRNNETSAVGSIWAPDDAGDPMFAGSVLGEGDPFGDDGFQGVRVKF